jgi:hypothetical protein
MHMRRIALVLIAVTALALPRAASAFCGFYVAGADSDLYNNATTVAMMRNGTRTVLSMQNNYQGPPKDFAMVVPVPVVLQKKNVKTLPRAIFDRLDRLAAPRLVEYWEQDPCPPDGGSIGIMRSGTIGAGSGTGSGYGAGGGGTRPKVVVEAQFTVGEYEIVILSAEDALSLETWLTESGYAIPDGAAKYLEPYVTAGMKFFVAKVDIEKVTMKDGMATLSPLRFWYDTEDFTLPIRLGLINSAGTQDLLVHILAPGKRYSVANYANVSIPTNLIVEDAVRERFGEFYAALFDATLEKNPGAVVTEYAWSASSCDPCPEEPLSPSELATLGADVVDGDGATGPRTAQLRLGSATVKGKLAVEVFRRYIRRWSPRLRQCYEQALLADPKLAGSVDVTVEADDAGKVTKVDVAGVKNEALRSCMATQLEAMQLPKGQGKFTGRAKVALASVAGRPYRDYVLTRLHARYDSDAIGEDLVFKEDAHVSGGTGGADELSSEATESSVSTFQGRYIIRHEWTGKMECETPRRGMWGGPPPGVKGNADPVPAQDLAFARRGGVNLTSMIAGPMPAGLAAGAGASPGGEGDDEEAAPSAEEDEGKQEPPATEKTSSGGCGCELGRAAGGGSLWLALVAAAWWLRRRRA